MSREPDEPIDAAASRYGDSFADVYDDWYGEVSDVGATVQVLRRLAGDGAVLELGVGTGRLAIPLAATGTRVTGLDASRPMLERLAANDPAGSVRPILADMASFRLDERYAVVLVAYNTLFNLASHELQQRCFSCVAAALEPGGHFVVEAFVPSDAVDDDRRVEAQIRGDAVVLTATVRDRDRHLVRGAHIELTAPTGVRLRPWVICHATPDELDAMARQVGFEVDARWADWSGRPFLDEAPRHVTIYRLPATSTPRPPC